MQIKELSEEELYIKLYEEDYKKRLKSKNIWDIWWQFRCLEDMGLISEARRFVLSNKKLIEKSNNEPLKEKLYFYLKDTKNFLAIVKKIAKDESKKDN